MNSHSISYWKPIRGTENNHQEQFPGADNRDLVVIKVVGRVELVVLSLGYCVPDVCEEFVPRDICEEFLDLPFTQIFPEQLNAF